MEQIRGICWGNSGPDSAQHRAWLIGFFKPPESPLYDPRVDVKVDFAQAGARRTKEEAKANSSKRTLQILISGKVQTSFVETDDRGEHHIILEKPGDYALWDPGTVYYWEILEDSLVITVCWPNQV